jgi:hypothetical protein
MTHPTLPSPASDDDAPAFRYGDLVADVLACAGTFDDGDVDAWRYLLTQVGEALRCDEPLPASVRARLVQANAEVLRRVIDGAAEDAALLAPPVGDDDHALESAVVGRDWLESVFWGARRAVLAASLDLGLVEPLSDALDRVDAAFASLPSSRLSASLGTRGALLGPGHWIERLRAESAADVDVRAPSGESEPGIPLQAWIDAGARPSASLVHRYVTRGVHRREVESWARTSPEHAREVVDAIEAALEIGDPVSLVSLRWRRGAPSVSMADASPDATVAAEHRAPLPLGVPRAVAAATEAPAALERPLGVLDDTGAEAVLRVVGDRYVLDVFEGDDPFVLARVGDKPLEAVPGRPGMHRVELSGRDLEGGLRLQVRCRSGSAFDEVLEVHAMPT